MTDGKINMGIGGELYKSFDIKDGYGINEIPPANSITPIIITGRTSRIVENRAKELHVDFLYQGIHDKLPFLENIIKEHGVAFEDVAFIGDDILDVKCIQKCGMGGCPADAVDEVKKVSKFISAKNGGEGAVREFIDYIAVVNKED